MMLSVTVAASCQPAEPVAVERGALDTTAHDAGVSTPSTSLLFRRVFLGGPREAAPSPREWHHGWPDAKVLAIGPGDDIWIAGRFFSSLQIGAAELTSAGHGDVFVVRLDPQGNLRWAGRLGGPEDDVCGGMAVDAEGNAVIAHQSFGRRQPPGPIMLAKLGANGDLLWQRTVASPSGEDPQQYLITAAADRAGGILIVGGDVDKHWVARVDANGDTVWRNGTLPLEEAEPVEIAVDSERNAFIGAGSTTGPSIRLMKVSASGTVQFKKRFSGHGEGINFASIGVDLQGNILLSGFGGVELGGSPTSPENRGDAWIAKLDPSGNRIWQLFGMAGHVAADGEGNVLCANLRSVAKLGPSGQWIWKYSPRIDDVPQLGLGNVVVAVDSADRVIYAGSFKGRIDLGDGPVESGDRAALFVAALAP
jgi:hypothetical protein